MAKNRKSTPSKKQRQEAMARQQAARRRTQIIIGGVVLLVVTGLLLWQLWPEPEPQVLTGERPLAGIDPFARNDFYDAYPEMMIDESRDYQAVIRTEQGDITFDLYTGDAPLTVNNFVFLANQGYYDGTTFHRVLENFMAQAGDPTGTGAGGPGYNFADEVDNGLAFNRPGLLAMANAGPGTNGSQFFVTFSVEQTQHLTGAHTIFGELVEGQDVLDSISLRDPNTASTPGDLIERIDIIEK